MPAFIFSHGLMNVAAPYTLNKFTITKFVVKNQIPRKYRVSIILDPVSTRMGRFYSISIGSVCRNGSITNSESSFTGVCTVQLHRISLPSFNEWLTWSPGGVCGRHRRQLSSSRLLGDRAFSSAAPRVWNRLPSTVNESSSLAVFKRQLKTHLFTASYFSNRITNSSLNCFIFLC